MDAFDNFKDNPNGVITDKNRGLEWLPKDSYGDLGRWVNYQEALSYLYTMIGVYAGGHNDWRLPTKDEALSLYHEDLNQLDWEGERIHIHSVFVTKCSFYIWTREENEEGQALVVNLRDGSTEFMDQGSREHLAARLVRTVPQNIS